MVWKMSSASVSSRPAAPAASSTGDSGGTYQTIGRVRYSGCSGRAIRYSLISFHTGEAMAASIHSCGWPASRAAC